MEDLRMSFDIIQKRKKDGGHEYKFSLGLCDLLYLVDVVYTFADVI